MPSTWHHSSSSEARGLHVCPPACENYTPDVSIVSNHRKKSAKVSKPRRLGLQAECAHRSPANGRTSSNSLAVRPSTAQRTPASVSRRKESGTASAGIHLGRNRAERGLCREFSSWRAQLAGLDVGRLAALHITPSVSSSCKTHGYSSILRLLSRCPISFPIGGTVSNAL
jgi:hypothetical protein